MMFFSGAMPGSVLFLLIKHNLFMGDYVRMIISVINIL